MEADEAPVGLELDDALSRKISASPIASLRGPCGLSIEPAAKNHQNVKRAPIVGAVLFLLR